MKINVLTKMIVVLAAVTLLSACGYGKKMEKMEAGFGSFMEDKLDLSDEQVAELDSFTEGKMLTMMKRNKLMMNSLWTLDPREEGYTDKVNAIAEEQAKAIEAEIKEYGELKVKVYEVLNDEQEEKLLELQANMLEKMNKMGNKE